MAQLFKVLYMFTYSIYNVTLKFEFFSYNYRMSQQALPQPQQQQFA